MTQRSLRHGARWGRRINTTFHVLKMGTLIGVALYLCISAIFTAATLIKWFDSHTLSYRSPVLVKFQSLVVVTDNEKEASRSASIIKTSPIATTEASLPISEYDQVMKQPHGEALWKIYMLESTRGRNDWCRNNGRGYGGFGVIGTDGIACYETFALASERANYWFGKLNPDKNLASALCQYNLGTPNLTNCVYYQHFLSL